MNYTTMKSTGILMSAPMVIATLNGTKTQTRRMNGLHKVNADKDAQFVRMQTLKCGSLAAVFENGNGELGSVKSPYGKPGDEIWVRETHLVRGAGAVVDYRADMDPIDAAGHGAFYGGWKPSLFMRREHSRIALEVVDIRIEKLNDISEDDAKAEGVEWVIGYHSRIPLFCQLWERINGLGSWNKNPYVWAVTFKMKP
jgi:hypothetical protein